MSHAYEYSCGRFLAIGIGAETYYAEGADALARNMLEARPTVIACVPRLMEVLHGRVVSGLKSMPPLKKKLFDAALRIGMQRYDDPSKLSLLDRLIDPILDKLVRKKVAARFGGRLRALVSGGAPMNVEIGRFFYALGVPVFQGYGQTEASPLIACNRPGMIRLDTVGPAIPGVEVKIAEDGEILVRGPNLMLGYWRDEEATAAARRDGWLHTGDIGELDELGRLKITDRKKDMIVVSGGDNISPAKVEGVMSLEPEIGQIMVYGDKHPYLVALVVPDETFLKSHADADASAISEALDKAIDRANAKLSQLERVRRFAVASEPFTIANGMMTPTLKVRRHVVKQTYGAQLEGLYEKRR
jgi:long-chain acyl-CoA synthetase